MEKLRLISGLSQKFNSIVFLDTETTGLNCKEDQIIELAAIKVKAGQNNEIAIEQQIDLFIKLPETKNIPAKITQLTGITDQMLEEKGVSEAEAIKKFKAMIKAGPTLLIAHNINFDVCFLAFMFQHQNERPEAKISLLDTLTVYKDRHSYPHRLENAIETYGLSKEVQNSHRAIDDVLALLKVTIAMSSENDNLEKYVNLIGYNPKYGIGNIKIKGMRYEPQALNQEQTLIERLAL